MPLSLKHFLKQLPPFILIGVSIALAIGIFIVFSYVLLWGIVIGGILWGANSLIQYFRNTNANSRTPVKKGRIIDHDKQ